LWMVLEREREYGSHREAVCSVAEMLGPAPEMARLWVPR
jgi:hypothetical protein